MSNFTDFFPAPGGGGGGIPETEIFTSSGVWTVPQTVLDKITADGHAEIGLLMVGAGNSTRSGEVVNQIYRLTSSDFDDPAAATKQVSVFIGGGGGDTGITSQAPAAPTTTLGLGSVAIGGSFITYPFPTSNPPEFDSNGYPTVNSIGLWTSPSVSYSNVSWSGSVAPDSTVLPNMTWTGGAPFDGTLQFRILYSGGSRAFYNFTYNRTDGRFQMVGYDAFGSGGSSTLTTAAGIVYENGNTPTKIARGAVNSDANNVFLTDPSSTYGYSSGFSRFNGGNYGSGGSNPQNGYVQIFF